MTPDAVSRDRPEGRPLRAVAPGRDGSGDGLRRRSAPGGRWRDAGFRWLHVVDLNGAFAGQAGQRRSGAGILAAVDLPVQLGGGIRDMAGIEAGFRPACAG